MDSLRIVKDDLLKDWLYFRDENFCSLVNAEDRKHMIKFDEISDSLTTVLLNFSFIIISFFINVYMALFLLLNIVFFCLLDTV